MVEDFWDIHFSHVTLEGKVVDSNMYGFSCNLFVVFVYHLELGDVGLAVVVGNAAFVNCTCDMTIVFFYSFPNIC